MDSDVCDRLRRLSVELSGNNVLLPVASAVAAMHERGISTFTAPLASVELGGKAPANRVGESLRRLHRIGVLRETPWLGRPHPREYQMVPGPFWALVREWTADPHADVVAAAGD